MPPKRKSGGGGEKSQKSKKAKPNGKAKGKKKEAEDQSDEYSDSPSEASSPEAEPLTYGNDLDQDNSNLQIKGPEHAGTLLICGGVNWDLTGRSSVLKGMKPTPPRNLCVPHRLTPLENIKVKLVVSSSSSAHSVIITEEGKAYTFGRNEKSQLGTGDQKRQDAPVLVEALKEHTVVGAATGRHHTLFLTERGTVYACGDNFRGQCGVGSSAAMISNVTRIHYQGPPIIKVAAGAEFSLILDLKGAMHSFGHPEYGQLGHGTTGEYLEVANKILYHHVKSPKQIVSFVEKSKDKGTEFLEPADIVDISCGVNHSVCIDSKKRVFSWGFGGYGRLGHAEQKDELVPRLLKLFVVQNTGIRSVYCGSAYSLAISEHGAVFQFGQQKKTGEAAMYPKPIRDLHGWNVRSVGCGNTSIVVAADKSVIAWGPAPAYGELGIGEERKSSTTPMEVKALDGIYIHQVSCGYSHTLFIARSDSEEERSKIEDLLEYDP